MTAWHGETHRNSFCSLVQLPPKVNMRRRCVGAPKKVNCVRQKICAGGPARADRRARRLLPPGGCADGLAVFCSCRRQRWFVPVAAPSVVAGTGRRKRPSEWPWRAPGPDFSMSSGLMNAPGRAKPGCNESGVIRRKSRQGYAPRRGTKSGTRKILASPASHLVLVRAEAATRIRPPSSLPWHSRAPRPRPLFPSPCSASAA